MSEYYGVASTPTEDFIAHYGIKGMKWGVRKAIQSGSDRALRRQYKKASKKLAKLEKLGANGKKYAKRAAAYGAGAAAAGGLAAAGTGGVATGIRYVGRGVKGAMKGVGGAMDVVGRGLAERRGVVGSIGNAIGSAGRSVKRAGKSINLTGAAQAVQDWGRSTSASDKARSVLEKNFRGSNSPLTGTASNVSGKLKGVHNDTIARIGAGAIGAGLGIAAGRNAYRAATAKKHAAQAKQFRAEMNKAFAGTKYANGMPSKKKKSRRG